MEEHSLPQNLAQPTLLEFKETTTGAVELFPAVWSALEDLTSPDDPVRASALERLETWGAARLSPLAAYVIATRLADPDVDLRARAVDMIGNALSHDAHGLPASEAVTRSLAAYLMHMRVRMIFALLEVVVLYPEMETHVARIYNACPYAGRHLADILMERKNSVPIRRQAAHFIGLVGFLDAAPALERLEARLAARLSGQQAMPFAPPALVDETELLPVIHKVLILLKSQ